MIRADVPPELVDVLLKADEAGCIVIPPGTKAERDSFLSILNDLKRKGLVTRETVDINYSPHWLTDTGEQLCTATRKKRGIKVEAKAATVKARVEVSETTIKCLCGNKISRVRSWFMMNRKVQCSRCRAMHVIEDLKNTIEDNEQLTRAIENFRKKLRRPTRPGRGMNYLPTAK